MPKGKKGFRCQCSGFRIQHLSSLPVPRNSESEVGTPRILRSSFPIPQSEICNPQSLLCCGSGFSCFLGGSFSLLDLRLGFGLSGFGFNFYPFNPFSELSPFPASVAEFSDIFLIFLGFLPGILHRLLGLFLSLPGRHFCALGGINFSLSFIALAQLFYFAFCGGQAG